MSQPISYCLQMRAVVEEEAHKMLMEIHKKNHINGGCYTRFGCSCTPPCHEKYSITNQMLEDYNKRTKKEWDIFIDEHDKESCGMCGEKSDN